MSSSPLQPSNESGQDPERPRQHLGIHAVNIYVRDQNQSLRFYLDQLGFDLAFDVQLQSGERWLAVAPPDGSALLSLVAPKPESPEFKLIGRPTGVVFVTEDVPAKYSEWRKRDVRFQYTPRLRRVKYERQPSAQALSSEEAEPALGRSVHTLQRSGRQLIRAGRVR